MPRLRKKVDHFCIGNGVHARLCTLLAKRVILTMQVLDLLDLRLGKFTKQQGNDFFYWQRGWFIQMQKTY